MLKNHIFPLVVIGLFSLDAFGGEMKHWTKSKSKEGEIYTRLKLGLGLASVSGNNATDDTARSQASFHRNGTGLLSSEVQYKDYLGGEFEGWYGKGKSNQYTKADNVNSTLQTADRNLSHYGFMFDVQGRHVLSNFSRDWGLHAGLGYGWMAVSEGNPVVASSTSVSNSKLRVSGLYATIGVESSVVEEVSLGVDFAMSLFGSASNSETGGGDAVTSFDSGRFTRFRANAAYILDPSYRVGLEYIRRMLKGRMDNNTEDTETANEFMAFFALIM